MRFAWPICLMLCATAPIPKTRTFHFEYRFEFPGYDVNAPHVQMWVPLPHDDPFQKIRNLVVETNAPYEVTRTGEGNEMAYVRFSGPVPENPKVKVSFDAMRSEHLQPGLAGTEHLAVDEDPKVLAKYLKPDRLVPIDGKIRQWAEEVVNQAHAKTGFGDGAGDLQPRSGDGEV